MRRSNEPKIYGPYQHGELWRLHVVTGSGSGRKTTYRGYPTRDLAEAAINGARSQAQGATVKQAVDALLEQMRADDLSEGTLVTNEYRLNAIFGLPGNAARPLRWLINRGSELYAALHARHKADTHQAELGLAKRVGELCVKRRWLRENPFANVEIRGRKVHGSTKPRLRVDESRKLMDYCLMHMFDDQGALITLSYLLLGSRASELVRRSKRDLDDGGRLICIDRTKTKAGTRRLRVPEEIRPALLELVKGKGPTDPIFTHDGKRATRHWAYRNVKRVCGAAKVPVLSPQALRRTSSDIATEMGELGPAIARHLGQRSSVVTDRSYRDRNVVEDARIERGRRALMETTLETGAEKKKGQRRESLTLLPTS